MQKQLLWVVLTGGHLWAARTSVVKGWAWVWQEALSSLGVQGPRSLAASTDTWGGEGLA